jgi:hypothetical protein
MLCTLTTWSAASSAIVLLVMQGYAAEPFIPSTTTKPAGESSNAKLRCEFVRRVGEAEKPRDKKIRPEYRAAFYEHGSRLMTATKQAHPDSTMRRHCA